MVLGVDPAKAAAWVQALRRAQIRRSLPETPTPPPPTSWPRLPAVAPSPSGAWGIETTQLPSAIGRPISPQTPPPLGGVTPPVPPGSNSPSSDWRSEPGTWQGNWQRDTANTPEVGGLPYIEVDLPSLLDGQAGAAQLADRAAAPRRPFAPR